MVHYAMTLVPTSKRQKKGKAVPLRYVPPKCNDMTKLVKSNILRIGMSLEELVEYPWTLKNKEPKRQRASLTLEKLPASRKANTEHAIPLLHVDRIV